MMLRYLIALDADVGIDGYETEIGYNAIRVPIHGIGIKYCNLRDQESPKSLREKNDGYFGPYLKIAGDDIFIDYAEPAPDPEGQGFWKLLRKQLMAAKSVGFQYIELDNLDTYSASVCLLVFNEVVSYGLKIYAKNVLMVDGDRRALLLHPAVVAQIVEKGEDGPLEYDKLRKQAGKPYLPTYFVARQEQRDWANEQVLAIHRNNITDMGVSYSDKGEYGSAIILLEPAKA